MNDNFSDLMNASVSLQETIIRVIAEAGDRMRGVLFNDDGGFKDVKRGQETKAILEIVREQSRMQVVFVDALLDGLKKSLDAQKALFKEVEGLDDAGNK